MKNLLNGAVPYKKEDIAKYEQMRWWPGLTFGDLIDRAADIYPDKEGFVDRTNRVTFSQAREKINKLAIAMMELGIKPLDRVLVQLPNWIEFVYTYFALQKIGAIGVLLIDRYRQHEISHLIKSTGATVWVVPELHRKVDYLPIIEDVVRENPQLEHIILARGTKKTSYQTIEDLINDTELTEDALRLLSDMRPDPNQVAHMGPTGGTTGIPKVVPRTHNSLICGFEYVARAWELTSNDICLLVGPIGHDLTFTKGLCPTLLTYGKSIFLDSTGHEEICKTIEVEKVTAVPWVPTLAKRMLTSGGLENYDFSSFKKMQCGGGASTPEIITEIRDKLGCLYTNAYGGTEGHTTMTRSNDDLDTILNTVGMPTCPYDVYKVIDPLGKELPPNTSGELIIKGPGVFTGYYNNPEENEGVFTEDGFFKTGDVAKINEQGYITLTGRMKEMINRGGESISAVEIEKLISIHPDVAMVAVIPVPDPLMGERVCAYIQPKADSELSFEEIISFLKGKKASVLQLPERIEFIDAMPFTKAEKIDKTFLKEDIKKRLTVQYK